MSTVLVRQSEDSQFPIEVTLDNNKRNLTLLAAKELKEKLENILVEAGVLSGANAGLPAGKKICPKAGMCAIRAGGCKCPDNVICPL